MTITNPIGILGGTFDPIHYGHLRMALELQQQLNLQEVRFIPCREPVHKKTVHATLEQRLHMLHLALAKQPKFLLDEREIKRTTPSYMVPTLESLQKDLGTAPLCLIMGIDAFAGLQSWYRWQEIFNLCHIIAIQRPDFSIPNSSDIAAILQKRQITDPQYLQKKTHGSVLLMKTTLLQISASEIRHQIANQKNPRYLLPDAVLEYIQEQKIYR